MNTKDQSRKEASIWAICLTGGLGLAVAMGVGRFAFTPLLPLMQREGLIDGGIGAWLASANYIGYFIGALTAAYLPGKTRTQVALSLLATVALTMGMAVQAEVVAWIVLRFLAGVVSAWTLVFVSGWAVSALALRKRSDASGWVFAGVGIGIALAGSWVWWRTNVDALSMWIQLGWLSLGITAVVVLLWPDLSADNRSDQSTQVHTAITYPRQTNRHSQVLVLCYGALGFGYILPATYLPTLAQGLIDDPRQFGLLWPIFGLAAAGSTLLAGRAMRRWRGRTIWAFSHVALAVGCLLPLFSRSGWAVMLAAIFVGGTFLVATMTGLQEARHANPSNPKHLLARMTAAFALGQIAGPLTVLLFNHLPLDAIGLSSLEFAQAVAALLLLISATWLHRLPHDSSHSLGIR